MKAFIAFTCLAALQPASAAKLTTRTDGPLEDEPEQLEDAVPVAREPLKVEDAFAVAIARESLKAPNHLHYWHDGELRKHKKPHEFCKGNRWPDAGTIVVHGMAKFDDILQNESLQKALSVDPDWQIGNPWNLTLIVNSLEREHVHQFAFSGGMFNFSVKPGTVDARVSMINNVSAEGNHTRMELRSEGTTKPHAITLSHVCLRPVTCEYYFEENKDMCTDGFWRRNETPSKVFGNERAVCCKEMKCADSEVCLPATAWENRPDYATADGSTHEHCCVAIRCDANASTCNTTKTVPKDGLFFGSTAAECCDPKPCAKHECSSKTQWTHKPSILDDVGRAVVRPGSTDEECCDPRPCSAFNCSHAGLGLWAFNQTANDSLLGSTPEECCSPLYCENHSCMPASEWEPKGIPNRMGSTNERCCSPKLCKRFECPEGKQLKALALAGGRGNSTEQCCEQAYCKNYTCSDDDKWEHKSDQDENDLDRKGFSDEECCDPVLCSANDCLPESKWKKRNATELNGSQGRTSEQCCEPRHCTAYNCTGDFPDLNVTSTKWYHKIDTNHHKWLGTSDEECCYPKYCSQFFTTFTTKYERKPEDGTNPRLGSSELECYNKVFCIEHECEDDKTRRKVPAGQIMGSTDEECCEKVVIVG